MSSSNSLIFKYIESTLIKFYGVTVQIYLKDNHKQLYFKYNIIIIIVTTIYSLLGLTKVPFKR